jgi:HK97 family phage portal protein
MSLARRASRAARAFFGKGITGAWVVGSSVDLPGFNTTKAYQTIEKSAILAMCIGRWGLEYPQVRMVVKDEKGKPQYDHAMQKLIYRPNEAMDQSELYVHLAMYRLFTGTAFIHILRNKTGNMVGLKPRHGHEISKRRDSTRKQIGWWFTDQRGQRTEVPMEDIVVMPWIVRNPNDVTLGLSPLQSCWPELTTYDIVSKFINQFIQNGAAPGTALIAKDGIEGSEDDKEKVHEDLAAKYTISRNGVGKMMLLEGDFDLKQFGSNLKDLALDGLRDTPEANIAGAFFVPPELIGLKVGLTNSTYSNKKEARKGFVENTLVPMWENDASRLGAILEQEFELSEWYVEADLSRVAALKEDEEKRHTRVLSGFEKNLYYRDQALAMLGEEPVDNAKVYAIDLLQQPLPVGKSDPKPRVKAGIDYDAMWKSLDDEKMVHVKAIEKALKKQMGVVVDIILSTAKGVGVKRDAKLPSDEELIKIFTEGTEEERLAMATAMMKRAVADADFDFDEIEGWLSGVLDGAAATSAQKISESHGTIRDQLQNIVAENAEATFDELKAALLKYVDDFDAKRIAQTTVTTTTSVAQQESWLSINDRRKDKKTIEQMWLSERDGKVRPKHALRDGKQAPIGEEIEGSKGPGLSGTASDDINCRCVLIPVTVPKE